MIGKIVWSTLALSMIESFPKWRKFNLEYPYDNLFATLAGENSFFTQTM
jgi:hypothetical protein